MISNILLLTTAILFSTGSQAESPLKLAEADSCMEALVQERADTRLQTLVVDEVILQRILLDAAETLEQTAATVRALTPDSELETDNLVDYYRAMLRLTYWQLNLTSSLRPWRHEEHLHALAKAMTQISPTTVPLQAHALYYTKENVLAEVESLHHGLINTASEVYASLVFHRQTRSARNVDRWTYLANLVDHVFKLNSRDGGLSSGFNVLPVVQATLGGLTALKRQLNADKDISASLRAEIQRVIEVMLYRGHHGLVFAIEDVRRPLNMYRKITDGQSPIVLADNSYTMQLNDICFLISQEIRAGLLPLLRLPANEELNFTTWDSTVRANYDTATRLSAHEQLIKGTWTQAPDAVQ